jgi:hypothetical protein
MFLLKPADGGVRRDPHAVLVGYKALATLTDRICSES